MHKPRIRKLNTIAFPLPMIVTFALAAAITVASTASGQTDATVDTLAGAAADASEATRTVRPAAVTPYLQQLVAIGSHDDTPVRRWTKLATDASALQRLVAIDELARAARFDSRAATVVRLLAAHDSDPRVRQKATLIAPRLARRLTVHVRRESSDDMPAVRVGWKHYAADELDTLVSALTQETTDPQEVAAITLSHGLTPSGELEAALVLAGGAETWADIEPIVQAMSAVGVKRIAAVSTTSRGQLTPDAVNLSLPERPRKLLTVDTNATPPLKILLGRTSNETTIRVVGLSDPQPSFAALTANLRALCRSAGNPTGPYTVDDAVVIDAGDSVHWLEVVEAINAVRTAGFRTVVMASIVPPDDTDNPIDDGGDASPTAADPDYGPELPEDAVVMFGTNLGQADSVVYVVDASGSQIATMSHVMRELQQSIGRLNDTQKFDVLFFRDGEAHQIPPTGMRLATQTERDRAVSWLTPAHNRARPAGRTDPIPALKVAFGYKPQLIVIISDNIRGDALSGHDHATLMRAIDKLDPHDRIRVSTVQWLYPDSVGTLAAMSKATDGVHRFVSPKDAGLTGRLPAVDPKIEDRTSGK